MSKKPRFIAMALLTFCNACLLYPQSKPQAPVVEDFDFEGTALFQCQCTAHACPCQKNGAPNHGTCEAADFVHIRTGRYGKLHLDGLNAVVVGNLVDKNTADSTPPFISTRKPIPPNVRRLLPFCNS